MRQRRGDLGWIVFGHAGEGNDGLVADFGTRIAQRPTQALRRARVANLPERRESHLANRRIRVLDGDEEGGKTLACAEIRQGYGRPRANACRAVLSEQPLESRYRARANLVCGERMTYEVANGRRACRGTVRADVSEARLEAAWKRRWGQHHRLRIACSARARLDVKDASCDEQARAGRKDRKRSREQDVRSTKHRGNALIQNSTQGHAVWGTKPHESE